MRSPKRILAIAAMVLLITAGSAAGTTYITGAQVKNESLSASDLGPDITRIKSVTITVEPGENSTTVQCYDVNPNACGEYENTGDGVIHRTVGCPSGNVTSGGLKFEDDADQFNLNVIDYPASDNSWSFALQNTGPDSIVVQLRVVCI